LYLLPAELAECPREAAATFRTRSVNEQVGERTVGILNLAEGDGTGRRSMLLGATAAVGATAAIVVTAGQFAAAQAPAPTISAPDLSPEGLR
jgi:hypothetical protein